MFRFFIRNKSTLQQRYRVYSLFDQGKKKNIETLANKSTLQWHKVRLLSDQGTKTNIEAWLKRVAITKMLFMVCSGLVVFLGIDALYAGYIEKNRIPRVVKKFETGSRDLNIPKEATFFPREKETTELKELISPSTPGFFNLVTGEHGTGKTTLVCHTCKNTPFGVLYIRVPDNPAMLTTTLGNSVDFDFEVHISFWSQLRRRFFAREDFPRPSELDLVLDGISSASYSYAIKHKRPVIIFIDNLTVLAKQKDIEPFQRLVRFAKTEADGGNLIVNFVASEGHTPRQLAELSEGSRLSMVVEIGDLDENQAIKFITRSGTDETTAKGIFNIVGGRVTYLKDAHLRVQKGETLKVIKESFVKRAGKEFGDLVLPKDPTKLTEKQKEAWKQIIAICDSPNKEISYTDFQESIGSASMADELLQMNVFAYHHGKDTVSLHSRPTELFVEQKQQLLKTYRKNKHL